MELKKEIRNLILTAIKKLNIEEEDFLVERPKDIRNGDLSTNIALVAAKKLGKAPFEIGEEIVKGLEKSNFEKIEVAKNGFINFYLSKQYFQDRVKEIIKKGADFGSLQVGKGKKVSVEYVSANPTGPLHIGNARGGPIGDVLANVLEKAGYSVEREYLHNNVGGQVMQLGKSIYFSLKPDSREEDEEVQYQGEYIKELAKEISSKVDIEKLSKDEFIAKAGEEAVGIMLEEILEDTKAMGINFDTIRNESDLKKEAPRIVEELKEKGFIKEKEGALWFAPSDEFLKDRETVVKKSDGEFTYFASDIVYHKEKFDKGNELVIDIWGSNHSGHVPRIQAAVKALGFNPANFKAILYQFVRIKRGEEVIKMSKRAGNFVTAREVLDEVGKDAFRFFMVMHKSQTHMDFDLELAKKKASENPSFYVQYAHSRICSIFRKSAHSNPSTIDYRLLTSVEEVALIRNLLKFPEIIEDITNSFSVNVLASYSTEIASLLHQFYEKHPVISDNKPLSNARLNLLKAVQIVLQNTLKLLGVSAPEKM